MKRRRIKRGVPSPDPILVPISGEFAGNDGPWSTLGIRIGDPPQFLRMMASTSSPEMWVIAPSGCTPDDTKDCAVERGQLFEKSQSASWKDWQNGTTFNLDSDRGLPMEGTGIYGLDTVQLTSRQTGPDGDPIIIPEQIIAQITTKDIFMGMFGLNPRPLSSNKLRPGHTSNLADMKNRGLIPSLSYGYTAGAKYRRLKSSSKPAHTQLVLGGYDKAMMKANDVEFKMGPESSGRDLAVWVRNIQYSNNASATVPITTEPFNAMIDTATSLYWLPPEVCKAFAHAFHLRYNSTVDMYLINETLHDQLTNINPSVSFTLGNDAITGKEVTFNLPYEAFELKLTREYTPGHAWSRYFPIRSTTNASQYTLGRAFLQETYLVANYETRNFSVSQRLLDGDRPDISSIRDPSRPGGDETSSAATYGLIAGGCALAGLLILLLAWRCGRRRSRDDTLNDSTGGKTELDSTSRTIYELDKGNEVYELPTKPTRVEAINPDMKCAFDDDVENAAAFGPFELPSNEVVERHEYAPAEASSSSSAETNAASQIPEPPIAHIMRREPSSPHIREEELISPIEGTYMGTFNQTISPITPTEPGLDTILENHKNKKAERSEKGEKS